MLENNLYFSFKEAIIRTIAFFDIFDYPLSVNEIWRFSPIKTSIDQIQLELNELEAKSKLESSMGFYYLPQRKEIIARRNKRYHYSERKIKRAIRVIRILKYIPWIEMVAVGNIIGTNNLKNKSDIDLFIVTETGRVWLVRFFCVVIVKFLGLRPRAGNIKDKICLSFYMANTDLSVKKLMLRPGKDYYFIYWLANLVLIYDKNKNFEKLTEDNMWIKEELPNWQPTIASQRRKLKKLETIWYRDILDLFLGGLDSVMGKWQQKKFPKEIKDNINIGTKVVVNDQILKFHINDRREKYRSLYIAKLKNIDV